MVDVDAKDLANQRQERVACARPVALVVLRCVVRLDPQKVLLLLLFSQVAAVPRHFVNELVDALQMLAHIRHWHAF